jgi:hypothetical protein
MLAHFIAAKKLTVDLIAKPTLPFVTAQSFTPKS